MGSKKQHDATTLVKKPTLFRSDAKNLKRKVNRKVPVGATSKKSDLGDQGDSGDDEIDDGDNLEDMEDIPEIEIDDNEFEKVIASDIYASDDGLDENNADDISRRDGGESASGAASLRRAVNAAKRLKGLNGGASTPHQVDLGDAILDIGGDSDKDGELVQYDAGAEDRFATQDSIVDLSSRKRKRTFKEADKKEIDNPESGDCPPDRQRGYVYLGRIPHGFYEKEMKSYFSQFGDVTRLRLSRNKHTGNSKHFAFIEFESEQVAKIVADTMDGYLLFDHVLKCQVVPYDRLHPDTFVGSEKRFRKVPWNKIERLRRNKSKSNEQYRKMVSKLLKAEEKKRDCLKKLGIIYEFPGYRAQAEKLMQ